MRKEHYSYAKCGLGVSPSQESPTLPMVVMEVSGVMAKNALENAFAETTESSDWLWQLLADVRGDVAKQPTAAAVRRMRARLEAGMKRPAKIAA